MGVSYSIEPRTGAKEKRWLFVIYVEAPSERTDDNWLDALYFRDVDRKHFGKLEYIGALGRRDWRAIATRILQDDAYRVSLLSSDPDLRRFWKRR